MVREKPRARADAQGFAGDACQSLATGSVSASVIVKSANAAAVVASESGSESAVVMTQRVRMSQNNTKAHHVGEKARTAGSAGSHG